MSSGVRPNPQVVGTSHQRPDMIGMNMILRMIVNMVGVIVITVVMIIFQKNGVTSMSHSGIYSQVLLVSTQS